MRVVRVVRHAEQTYYDHRFGPNVSAGQQCSTLSNWISFAVPHMDVTRVWFMGDLSRIAEDGGLL